MPQQQNPTLASKRFSIRHSSDETFIGCQREQPWEILRGGQQHAIDVHSRPRLTQRARRHTTDDDSLSIEECNESL